ncbi:hypothetical protein MVEN_02615400 [Mycena venus]|uniref:Uncharacterized protein n=1 Tax=Mycena venus TaxID=2733690 RepID=A0A8H6WT19_9AGAR|nr:hypothetical protein MVEN_02615400 [Mycena venus]
MNSQPPPTTSTTASSLGSTTTTDTSSSSAMQDAGSTALGEAQKSMQADEDSAPITSATTTANAAGMRSVGYKGKALRSWLQLPPEIIRLIATYHLCIIDANSPLPTTWDVDSLTAVIREQGREHPERQQRHRYIPWPEYMVYVAARDTREMENLMCVCPQWGLAVEHHDFWNTAVQLFDPHNGYAHFGWVAAPAPANSNNSSSAAPAAARASPYRHFRALLTYSCLPCRVNAPKSSTGLGNARRQASCLRIGHILLCREHASAAERTNIRRNLLSGGSRWCGVCLVDGELARRSRAEAVRMAREDLARAEGALATARFHASAVAAHGGHGSLIHGGLAVGAGLAIGSGLGPGMGMTPASAAALVDAARAACEAALARVHKAEDEAYAYLQPYGRHGLPFDAGVVENEDEAVFPGVGATCRSCRAEWLWRYALLAARVSPLSISRGRIIPPSTTRSGQQGKSSSADCVAKGAVSAFIVLDEGSVNNVLVVAGERGWLRVQTRWAEMMERAMAAKRWGAGEATATTTTRQGHDYSQAVLVTRDQRDGREKSRGDPRREQEERLRGANRTRRGRSRSLESVDPNDRYTNNDTNAAAYARAGYTTTQSHASPAGYYDYDEEELGSELTDDEDYLDEDDDEYDLDEDGEDGVAVALEMSVKEMALGDWARAKILDGAWLAPADVYFGKQGGLENPELGVRAVHPVSWSISPPSSPPHPSTASSALPTAAAAPAPATPEVHPGPPTPPPPTYALAEAAHNAHVKNMRTVLLPVFKNVVRRLIVECALDAADADAAVEAGLSASRKPLDPAMRAARMSLADVVQQLREEEGVWFDGMDWSAKRRNARAEDQEREREQEREKERHRAEGSDDSYAGTPRTSDTSPVLSTSTLGTTPSPPPLGEREHEERQRKEKHAAARVEEREIKPTIPVSPVLNPPRLLRPIPYIPETIAHLPPYSLDAIKAVWREACAPLYHCRCTVCERAMAAQQAAQGGNASKATTSPATTTISVPPAPTPAAKENKETPREKDSDGSPWVMHIPAEDETTAGAESVIKLVEDDGMSRRTRGPGAWEREMELVDEMASGKLKTPYSVDGAFLMDGEEYEDDDDDEEERGAFPLAAVPAGWTPTGTGRKRSVDELEGEPQREGTPPKRARTVEPPSPRLSKRRSDSAELDDVETASTGSAPKRARLDSVDSPPDSSTPATTTSEDSYDPDRHTSLRHPVLNSK